MGSDLPRNPSEELISRALKQFERPKRGRCSWLGGAACGEGDESALEAGHAGHLARPPASLGARAATLQLSPAGQPGKSPETWPLKGLELHETPWRSTKTVKHR